ncbi:MAG TPA: hypothetical protein VGO57_12385 [Verrucomicrobiae bacterium]|jgi:hypothetical protein
MHRFKIALAVIGTGLTLAFSAGAQDLTNAPATLIENFELQTGTVMVKASTPVNSVTVGGGAITINAKESTDVNHGQKLYGITIGWNGGANPPAATIPKGYLVVDYDELDSLINGINYISNITYEVTSMPTFEVSYTTKSGIRIIAHSDRKQGGINAYLQLGDWPRIKLNSDQLGQLKTVIVQAKAALDAIK